MYDSIRTFVIAVLIAAPAAAQSIQFTPRTVDVRGQQISVEMGEFEVAENRSNPRSRQIKLRLARLKSTAANPGPPIVYLAGGPGGSGIGAARSERLPLFLALREFGDVIAFDQRGTGDSEPDLDCQSSAAIPFGEPLHRARAGAVMTAMVRSCVEKHRAQGVDLAGYNTRENAADLMDLRKALGAEKLVLWGISYGTHLALATLKAHESHVDRLILAGIEGLDDTYKLPSDQQTLLEEIARMVPGDLLASMRNILRELEREPKRVQLTNPTDGREATIVLGPLDFQAVVAGWLNGPGSFNILPDFVTRVEGGDWMALALAAVPLRMPSRLNLMSLAMDCASGMTAARRAVITEEAKRTLLGDAINAPFPEVCAGMPVPDLGDAYRAPVRSQVPALLISGTLDGRTRPRQAEELRLGLPRAQHLIIEGAGHSDPLFLSSPKILEAMKSFLRGERLQERIIRLDPVEFLPARTVARLPNEVLERYVGAYQVGERSVRRVVLAGDTLYTILGQAAPRALRPKSESEFFYEGSPLWVTFEPNPDGSVAAMILHLPDGARQRAPRIP